MKDVTKFQEALAESEAEVLKLRQVCAAAYQLAGLVGAPVRFLDAFGDAANGEIGKRTDPEKLLPVDLSECDQCAPPEAAPMTSGHIPEDIAGIDEAEAYARGWNECAKQYGLLK